MDGQTLPLAITMMAGPQIMCSFLFVTSEKGPIRVSLAYVAAVGAAAVTGVAIAMLVTGLLGERVAPSDSSGPSTTAKIIQIALVALLILASIRSYRHRATSKPPKWLGTVQGAGPGRAFRFGLLLILLMPSDFVIMLTTGLHLQSTNSPITDAIPFFALTVLIAALPLLGYVLFRRRAEAVMPKVRDWMNTNSWLVNIFVYAIFILLILT